MTIDRPQSYNEMTNVNDQLILGAGQTIKKLI